MRELKKVFTELAPPPVGPYSQAVWAGDTLYLSGQIALCSLDKDIEAQTKKVCENIKCILEAANLTLENTVKTACFLKDMSDFAKFNAVYQNYFSHKPARSCLEASRLPKDALIEIEVIAVR